MGTDTLDSVLHVSARLRIVAALAALTEGDSLSFTRLQEMLEPTPGNLITHQRKLEDAGYLTSETTGNGRASLTSITLTRTGRVALDAYTHQLRELLDGLPTANAPDSLTPALPRRRLHDDCA
jgi:DNA-binding MarR family transcriptional regulator